MKKHIIVIGGGVGGTAAAHHLVARGYEVTIIEQNPQLGGRVRSITAEGVTFEMGAGFMTKAYVNVLDFVHSNGLENRLYSQQGSSGIFRGNKVKMATVSSLAGNDTLSLGAKSQVFPILVKIIGNWRRLNMQAPRQAATLDTRTAAEMFAGRSGKEFLEYVIQPVLNGYFYWTPEHTSEAMLLMIGKAMLQGGTFRLQGGLRQLPERAAADSTVLLSHTVTNVRQKPDHMYEVTVTHLGKDSRFSADGIVCATTASIVPKIFPALSEKQKNFFASVQYSSTAVVARIYEQSDTKGSKGIAFPRQEGSNLAAITSSPETRQSGDGLSTVKIYASGTHNPALLQQSDQDIITTLTDEASSAQETVLHSDARALATHVQRWPEALPMFDVGHFRKLQAFAEGAIENPHSGLVFAGDYLGGPFMEGAFTSGLQAAERLDAHLGATN